MCQLPIFLRQTLIKNDYEKNTNNKTVKDVLKVFTWQFFDFLVVGS